MREGDFPPLAIPVGDECEFTRHTVDVVRFVYAIRTYCFPTLGRGPGFCLGPAYPRPGP